MALVVVMVMVLLVMVMVAMVVCEGGWEKRGQIEVCLREKLKIC